LIVEGCDFLKPLIIKRANKNPIARPTIGEIIINNTIFVTPGTLTEPVPAAATPAPIRAPTRAWLLDVGRARYQVIKSQIIAPTRVAKIRFTVITWLSMIPFPIVVAMAVPKKSGPTRLKKAAIVTAFSGESTFVATTVAMAFAESWNPFMKSKNSPIIIVNMTKFSRKIAS
jgi:hypothetical protein